MTRSEQTSPVASSALETQVSLLARMAKRAELECDSDKVRWFVAEMLDMNPEEESAFLDQISDAVWLRLLAGEVA